MLRLPLGLQLHHDKIQFHHDANIVTTITLLLSGWGSMLGGVMKRRVFIAWLSPSSMASNNVSPFPSSSKALPLITVGGFGYCKCERLQASQHGDRSGLVVLGFLRRLRQTPYQTILETAFRWFVAPKNPTSV